MARKPNLVTELEKLREYMEWASPEELETLLKHPKYKELQTALVRLKNEIDLRRQLARLKKVVQ